jgi:hypothetical protein
MSKNKKTSPAQSTVLRFSPTMFWQRLRIRHGQNGALLLLAMALLMLGAVVFSISAEKPWGKTVMKRVAKHQPLQPKEHAIIGLWWGAVSSAGILAVLLASARMWMPKGRFQVQGSRFQEEESETKPALKPEPLNLKPSCILWLGLIAAVAWGAWERYPRLNHSLWNDEEYAMRKFAHGGWVSKNDSALIFEPVTWTDTLFENRNGNNHILNSLVTRISLETWREMKGATRDAFSETALRMPAFITGLLTIAMVFLLGRAMGSPWTGLGAALLLAAHPWHIRYAVEAKGYSMMLFFVCLNLLALHRAMKNNSRAWWLVFAATEAAYLLSFAGALYIAIAANLIALIELVRGRDVRRVFTLVAFNLMAAVPVLVLMLPSVPQILAYLKSDDSLHLGMGADWRMDLFGHFLIGFPYDNWLPAQHLGTGLQLCFKASRSAHIFLGFVLPGLALIGVLCATVKNAAGRLFVIAPTLAALLSFGHNAAQNSPMVVWYLLYGLIPLALALPLAFEMLVKKPRWLAPSLMMGIVCAYAFFSAEARGDIRNHDRQPIRQTVAFIDKQSPDAISAIFGVSDRQTASYDTDARVITKREELLELIKRSVHERRDLYVYFCSELESGKRRPELVEALKNGCATPLAGGWTAKFERVQTFMGLEELWTYQIYRLANAGEVSLP